MRGRNYYVNSEDAAYLARLKEEYESMGRECKIEGSRLTVFAGKAPVPAKPKKSYKKKFDKKPRPKVDSTEKKPAPTRR